MTALESPPTLTFLEGAASIGARLCRDAVWDGERCNWLGASMEAVAGQWQVVQRSFGPDLYAGTSGIAWFLAELYAQTGEEPFRRAAEGAAKQALAHAANLPPVAYYVGQVGLAHVLWRIGLCLQRPAWQENADGLLQTAMQADLATQGLDVLAGVAGVIPALLDLYAASGQDELLTFARRCGDHLLETARQRGAAWSWGLPGDAPDAPHLTGFSHGAAGMGWALLELHHVSPDPRYLTAASGAWQYERELFDPQQQNWPDLRSDPGRPASSEKHCMLAWCHGAPGIALSRLRASELTGDATLRQEAQTAVQTTSRMLQDALRQPGGSFSLCHGLAGNADMLLYAAQVLAQPAAAELAHQVGRWGLSTYEEPRSAWPCGVMGGGESPNLMLGLAGIGHFYLRLHDPVQVPSALLLVPRSGAGSGSEMTRT